MAYQDPKGTTRDSWWDSGVVYIVFGLASLFILSMGLFNWPANDLTAVSVHVGAGWKVLGVALWLVFAGLIFGMATDKINAALGVIALAGVCLALSLCAFCGFWIGVH
jgi:hypothetical protein